MQYKDFSYCAVCRSKKNLEQYTGDFEVTMLLNTLYLAVMHPIEKREDLHLKTKGVVKYLMDNRIFHNHSNSDLCGDTIIRMLRNGLAHLNVEIPEGNNLENKIENIRICAKDMEIKPYCKEQCKERKCIPPKIGNANGVVCDFTFSIPQLREFTDMVIVGVLSKVPEGLCKICEYKGEIEVDQCPD